MRAREVYLDYAAATPVDSRVFSAMKPFFTEHFANPSSVHRAGVFVRQAIDTARTQVAALVGAKGEGVVFTASTTEAHALLFSSVFSRTTKRHAVALSIEHKSVLAALEQAGFSVTLVPVTTTGIVRVEDVLAAITADTALVSVQLLNNELGVLQPVLQIGKAIAAMTQEKPIFHSDVSQATLTQVIDMSGMHLDAVTFSAAKMYGPKGVAALVVRKGLHLAPFLVGGGQERGLRAGTENVSAIVGFGEAARLCVQERGDRVAHFSTLQKVFLEEISHIGLSVSVTPSVGSHILSVFVRQDAEMLMIHLENAGFFVSAASACTRNTTTSHVLLALGLSASDVSQTIRVSFGVSTTVRDVRRFARLLKA